MSLSSVLRVLVVSLTASILLVTTGNGFIPAAADDPGDDADAILFGMHYVNFAWGGTCHGLVIDTAGNVHAYHLRDESGKIHGLTDQLLEAKHVKDIRALVGSERCAFLTTVDAQDLEFLVPMIPTSQGTMNKHGGAFDAGLATYYANHFPRAKGKAEQIILATRGDRLSDNEDWQAGVLFYWLRGLHADLERSPAWMEIRM